MTATVAGIHLGLDTHANRPAANTVPDGSFYSCSTHSLIYKSDFAGNSWSTWATVGGAGSSISDQGTFTYLDATEAAAPATPATGYARIYAKSDGRIYSKDDAGTEYGPFDAGGGAGSGYSAAILAHPDLIHYWPMADAVGLNATLAEANGGTGLSARPASPGTVYSTGFSITNDSPGGSAAMGINYLRRAVIANVFKNTNPWSVELWIVGMTYGGNGGIVSHWDGTHGFNLYTGGRLYYGSGFGTFTLTNAMYYGKHHIVITWDGTTNKLYWDGSQVTVTSPQTGTTSDSSQPFLVGRYGAETGDQQGMLVSDVAIYNDDLSGAEISANYALGS